jgi:hypothetical protein
MIMENEEDLISVYMKRVNESSRPGYQLAEFYAKMFGIEIDTKKIALFSKSVRMYGRELVFLAITDVYGMDNVDIKTDISGLLRYFINKRMERKFPASSYYDLTAELERMEKAMDKQKGTEYIVKDYE